MRYRRVYEMLKRAGHTPTKATEIILDAKRRQQVAINWIRTLRRART